MSDGRIPAYLLAGGLALVIPAVVIMLDQTRYLPAEGAREDRPVTNLPSESETVTVMLTSLAWS